MIKQVVKNIEEAKKIEAQVNGLMACKTIEDETFNGLDVWYRNKKDLEAGKPEKAELTIDLSMPSKANGNIVDLMSVAYGNAKQKKSAIKRFAKEGKTAEQINEAVKVVTR